MKLQKLHRQLIIVLFVAVPLVTAGVGALYGADNPQKRVSVDVSEEPIEVTDNTEAVQFDTLSEQEQEIFLDAKTGDNSVTHTTSKDVPIFEGVRAVQYGGATYAVFTAERPMGPIVEPAVLGFFTGMLVDIVLITGYMTVYNYRELTRQTRRRGAS